MTDDVSRETPPVPASARGVFGERLELAQRYVAWLADAGTVRGLIGPRERTRLWERHVLNSAVIAELMPSGSRVADIGSGAGLPGLVLGIARPDLDITLIEPLLRRTRFLQEVVTDLGLENVHVLRARAEDVDVVKSQGDGFDVVTSRAVAPMSRLAQWSLPLVRVGGVFLPMKGSSAADELVEAQQTLTALGAEVREVVTVGAGTVEEPVTVVRIVKTSSGHGDRPTSKRSTTPRTTRGNRNPHARRGTQR